MGHAAISSATSATGTVAGGIVVASGASFDVNGKTIGADAAELTYSGALRFIGTPAYYLGLVPEFINPDERELPPVRAGEVAGIVTLFMVDRPRPAMAAWLRGAIAAGIKVAAFGEPGLSDAAVLRDTYGMLRSQNETAPVAPVVFSKKTPAIGFEITPIPGKLNFTALTAPAGSELLLQARDGRGELMDAVAYTPWGGYALENFAVITLPGNNGDRWVINPFAFFQQAKCRNWSFLRSSFGVTKGNSPLMLGVAQ